jgi:hypothetical protein
MAMYSMKLDKKADALLEKLKCQLGATSKAEVLRLAVALLKTVQEGRQQGMKVALINDGGRVQAELILPGCAPTNNVGVRAELITLG